MPFNKNEFVTHPKKPDWGVGIITETERGGDVHVYFENAIGVKKIRTSAIKLDLVEDPGPSREFLENVLVTDSNKGTMDRQPFPIVVENFRKNFKGGLNGRYLEEHERCFKQKAHEDFSTRLNQAEFDRLMKDGDWTELASRIKKSHTINLLGSFEIIKFSDVLKDPNTQEDISCGLYDLLYGKDDISERFMRYAGVLARYELDKWPIITLPLFLCFPDQYMFIKPTVTQEAAANRGFDIQYDSQINWNTFNQVQKFSNDLFERLKAYSNPELNPRDMIDVQTFMWCTFTKGYTAEEIQKAQQH